jgi:hypothetical protein
MVLVGARNLASPNPSLVIKGMLGRDLDLSEVSIGEFSIAKLSSPKCSRDEEARR